MTVGELAELLDGRDSGAEVLVDDAPVSVRRASGDGPVELASTTGFRELLERIATEPLGIDEVRVLANMAVRGAEFHA